MDSRAKLSKETIDRAIGGQNGLYIMVSKLTQRILRMLRLCSGTITLGLSMLTLSLG
jgi:hypothetical protein